nr:hypothetical protein CIT39_27005 [Bradyrhizobium symbiodeficiens]
MVLGIGRVNLSEVMRIESCVRILHEHFENSGIVHMGVQLVFPILFLFRSQRHDFVTPAAAQDVLHFFAEIGRIEGID